MAELELTLEELADRVGLSVRTIRFYITENLLPGSTGRGKAATYGEEQVLRLRLIRLLSEQHMPLAEIRSLLAPLSLDEIRLLLMQKEQELEHSHKLSPKDYIGTLLQQAQQVREPSKPYPTFPIPIPPVAPPQPSIPQAPTLEQETWLRWQLAPGVELHIKKSTQQRYQKWIDQTIQIFNNSNR